MAKTRTLLASAVVVLGFAGTANAQNIAITSVSRQLGQGGVVSTGPYGTFTSVIMPPTSHSVFVDYGEYDNQGVFVPKGGPSYPNGHYAPQYNPPINPQAWNVQNRVNWPVAPTNAAKARAQLQKLGSGGWVTIAYDYRSVN